MNNSRSTRPASLAGLILAIVLILVSSVAYAQPGTDILAGEDALSEVSIDVNPTNSQNMVIAGHSEDIDTMNTFFTMDGGQTWTPVPIDDGDDGITNPIRFDPSVAFDADGNVYVAYGATFGSPAQTSLIVATSTDGGQTYTQFTTLATNTDLTVPGNDKWHLGTGPDPDDASQENVYIAWTQNISEASGTDQRIVASVSTDAGATFSAPVIINDGSISGTDAGNLFADPAVGPNGELYVAWHDIPSGNVLQDVSTDAGATWGTDSTVVTSNTGFKTSVPPQPDRGVHVGPTIDTDRSGGAFDGRLYLTYTDTGAGGLPDVDIFVTYSDDDGGTWSTPVLVNDDGGTNTQFLPWSDVDQETGLLTTVWYDARNDTNNQSVEVFMAVSGDGGDTFDPNLLVSDNPSNMSTANTDRVPQNFLEYIGIATFDCLAVPVWADNSATWDDTDDLDYMVDRVVLHTEGFCNQIPVADADGPYTTDEGTNVTLDGTGSSDPDSDPLTFEWDFDADGMFDDATGPTPEFDLVGQDGVFTVALRVTDPDGASDTDETTVTVNNVAPSVSLASDAPVDENSPVTVSGTISDPGWLDPLSATIDWGDGTPVETITGTLENERPDATLTFDVSHVYGDNGNLTDIFTAEVCGSDDDTFTCDTIFLQINNVDPTAEILPAGALLVGPPHTFLAHAGDPIDFEGRSTDPGSDDLFLDWDWGDGTTDSATYLVNPPNPDPFPSPSIQPRDVTDMQTHAFADACLFKITFSSEDDDSGSASDTATVLIVGNADEVRSAGFWQHQFKGNGRTHVSPEELECYLLIVDHLSDVFHEVVDASDSAKAFDVLNVKGNSGSMEEIFDRQLLAAWLNFANGAVEWDEMIDTDGDGTADTAFSDVMATAETVRLDPGHTRQELEAQKDILERINEGLG